MNALEVLNNIIDTKLVNEDLRYCLVSSTKIPYKIDGTNARPNVKEDFVDIMKLPTADLKNYAGLGISIQASNVCGIDLDHCVDIPFLASTISPLASEIVEMFKDWAYIEFSFSGTGLRILYRQKDIPDYTSTYLTKNSKLHIEYYQPSNNARYLTITGKYLYNNSLNNTNDYSEVIRCFLDKYMHKTNNINILNNTNEIKSDIPFEQLKENCRVHLLTSGYFCELWFHQAPGSGSDESERDYWLMKYIYTHLTKDKEQVRLLIEESEFFKTKDFKHKMKWEKNNHRYFNTQFEHMLERLGEQQ